MTPSGKPDALNAVSTAFRHWKRLLFSDFSFRKWCWWTLVAMGAGLGGGGGGGGNFFSPGHVPSSENGKNPSEIFEKIRPYIDAFFQDGKMVLMLTLCAAAVALLVLVFMYFAAGLRFVFLDNVARNHTAVMAPFREYAGEAFGYFGFMCLQGLAALLFVAGPIVWLLWSWLAHGEFPGLGPLLAAIACVLLTVFLLVLADVYAYDFVLPAMYLRRLPLWKGWSAALALASGQPLAVLLYLLLKIALMIAFGIATAIAALLVLIPMVLALAVPAAVLGALIFASGWNWRWLWLLVPLGTLGIFALWFAAAFVSLPMMVFSRLYSLSFLEGFGENWRVLNPLASAPPPAAPPAAA
jgi:hypothetical protein